MRRHGADTVQPQLPPIDTNNTVPSKAGPASRKEVSQKRRNSNGNGNNGNNNQRQHARSGSYGWAVRSPGVPTARNSFRGELTMAWRHVLRPSRVWRLRIRFMVVLLGLIFLLDAWLIARHQPVGARVPPSAIKEKERPRVFIASIHRHTEPMVRSYWGEALVDLIRYLGPENVYVSIYESGSVVDDTKGALADLDRKLDTMNVARTITIDPIDQIEEVQREVVENEDGWIWTSRQKYELRRIPYLANLRNRVMGYLYEQEKKGERYDHVLWINDVVFNTEDVTTLLSTNDGIFDSACGLDFKQTHGYYDTFALRDSLGAKALPNTWPYFTTSAPRDHLIDLKPISVKSCWNGIIAMKAAPFYTQSPLRFRGVPDSLAAYHLEGSECCFIHADNNGTVAGHGVWLNPNVRVGYTGKVYKAVNPEDGMWPGTREKVWGMWMNRWQRMIAWPKRQLEAGVVRKRVQEWMSVIGEKEYRAHGEAEHCLINEMQVLESAGWRHL